MDAVARTCNGDEVGSSYPICHFWTAATAMRVVIADDHSIVRAGLAALISAMHGMQVVADAQDGHQLLPLLDSAKPDVVLLDLNMPGSDGFTLVRKIRNAHPELRVVLMSEDNSLETVKRAIESGASGFVAKSAPSRELELTLRNIAVSGGHLSFAVVQQLLADAGADSSPNTDLTARQLEVATLLAQGLSSKQIAFQLGLNEKTVHVHRARIFHRLGVKDIPSLARYALRKGLIRP